MKYIYILASLLYFHFLTFSQSPNIYGVTSKGGKYDAGVIYKTDASGNNYQKIKDLEAHPFNLSNNLCKATNGNYYGIGRQSDLAYIYKYDPVTLETTIIQDLSTAIGYTSANKPYDLTAAGNGKLYGTLYDLNGYGGIIEFDPATNITSVKYTFTGGSNGQYPYCSLYPASNNKLYGSTEGGGSAGNGIFFEYDYTTNTFTKKDDMSGSGHISFELKESNGVLYALSGSFSSGSNVATVNAIYEYNLTSGLSITNSFMMMGTSFASFTTNSTGLELDPNGNLYCSGGNNSILSFYEYNPSTIRCYEVYTSASMGLHLTGNLKSINSKLYCAGYTLCVVQPADSTCYDFKMYEFDASTYSFTSKATISGIDNTLYTSYTNYNTSFTGSSGGQIMAVINNAVIEYNTSSDVISKKSQLGRVYGAFPNGKPLLKNDHIYCYTQTFANTKQDFGPMFNFDVNTSLITQPVPSSYSSGGNFIDLSPTHFMASFGLGKTAIASYNMNTTNGTYSVISQGNSGVSPSGYFTQGADGFIYGSGEYNMNGSSGTAIYAIDQASNDEYLINVFTNVLQGTNNRGIVQASNGKIYGVSYDGGVFSKGVLYSLDLYNYNVTKLIDFNGVNRGAYPDGQLIQAANGKLYGTTSSGGTYNKGVLFAFDITTNLIQKLVDFDGTNKGQTPNGYLQLLPNNIIMGMTKEGGVNGKGVLYTYNYATNTFSKKLDFDGTNGAAPYKCGFTFDCSMEPIPSAGPDKSVCNNAQLALGDPNNSTLYSYIWNPVTNLTNPTSPTPILTVSSPTAMYVMTAACDQSNVIDTVYINSIAPLTPSICVVSVDSASLFNYIYWDKTPYTNVDSFIVYREVLSGYYLRIGGQKYGALSQFKDSIQAIGPANGNPNVGTYRYKIQIKDSCGNLSALSAYHNSIYFVDNSGTFTWNTYNVQGQSLTPVTQFDLMRDDISDGTWHVVGTVAGTQNVLNDPAYSTYQNTARWRVEALGFNCTPLAKTAAVQAQVNKSKSNVKNNFVITGVSGTELNTSTHVTPNPAKDIVTIQSAAEIKKIVIYNNMGQIVIEQANKDKQATIQISELSSGLYTIVIESEAGKVMKKIVKE
ncbi:MAG: T9SS type A sorting domain-containing protein [Bacteroidetes bacterium]|nr:T9SS type A sorting domain-containing protein [Bacteroidota bacterium]